jgi:glutamate synthase domain-containing protein 1/glutamate synthase domain-containing protein 3
MHNRGNGKGGGIAAVGFDCERLGVSQEVLDNYYMLHVAFLYSGVRADLEKKYIKPYFDIAFSCELDKVKDWKSVKGLEVRPPDVHRYFVRVKDSVLDSFVKENKLNGLDRSAAEDEFVNQNSFRLNQEYYASLGEQKAFVLSHGRNIMILKVVGYAEAIVEYYGIEDLSAHVWIAHQRYPTKGRVWHPGGAHPFAGINMALVHNGDFANYHSVSEYLKQRNIYPQFLTDTEVSALLFDLLSRTYGYPLEHIIEALAPTTELDFDRLNSDKQKEYRAVQATHIHGSPDGPWFFIIARNLAGENKYQLLGITDTAMLRPQVFAFSDGEVQVGLIASEKQAIDATLMSLSKSDQRICPIADRYWNARGGSYTDGGSFIFDLEKNGDGAVRIKCTDKFGKPVPMPESTEACDFTKEVDISELDAQVITVDRLFVSEGAVGVFKYVRDHIQQWSYEDIRAIGRTISRLGQEEKNTSAAIEALTLLIDRKYSTGSRKRNHIVYLLTMELYRLFRLLPRLGAKKADENSYHLVDFENRKIFCKPRDEKEVLVIDASEFQAEGSECDAALLKNAFIKGWRNFIVFDCRGQRYVGCGLGPETDGVKIDVYGSSGDYLGSGLDGLTMTVHGNAQDQLGQIIKTGKMVIYGDVGQTFMYGAKGGQVYVLGNAAGRPLINSVGRPKVVINGTCLDFLAESCMAGDPLNGGGVVILNGIKLEDGKMVPLEEPYPGSNLFSLASGGAIYVRDPHRKLVEQQLNCGAFVSLSSADWELILPYLEENERLFGIKVADLLTVDSCRCDPAEVYRKVVPTTSAVTESIMDTDDSMLSQEPMETADILTE